MGENGLLVAALDYARRGIPVIPLHNPEPGGGCSCGNPECGKTTGKHPRTKRGVNDATTDEGVIRSWWWSYPDANIGIAMGGESGIVALDVDHEAALEVWEAQNGDLPDGPRQTTGNGEHRLFRSNGTGIRNAVRFAPGLDMRSTGGYIVAAPSVHVSGIMYEWDPDHTLDEAIPELPKSIADLCAARPTTAVESHQPLDPALILLGIPEGERNDTLYRYACRLIGHNKLTLVEARPLVFQAGKACKPPLSDSEIGTIFKSASKHATMPVLDQPIPLDTDPPPTFPLDALPDPLRQYVVEVAASVQIPIDAVALMALSALSVCTCRRVRVQLPTHKEWTNTYSVVALPPGSRKSSAFEMIFGVIWEMQAKWQAEVAPEIQVRNDLRDTEERRIAALKAQAGKAKKEHERQSLIEQITEARASMTPEKHEPLIWIGGDVTQERLSQLLAQQGERLAILDAEGTLFNMIAGLYSGKPNFDLLLKCWRGDPHRVERVGREAVKLVSPLLTMCVTTQPSVIAGLAETKQFQGQGLLGRILFCVPPSIVGTRTYQQRAVDPELAAEYNEAIRQTYRATWADEHVVHVYNGALERWAEFHDDVEARQATGKDLEDMREFASKIAGMVAGIAGSLYMLEHRLGTPPGKLSERHMAAAVDIGHWAIGHARAAANIMTKSPTDDIAQRIVKWIQDEGLQQFTLRDLLRKMRTLKKDTAEPALKILIDTGHISICPRPGLTGGRPKGVIYEVARS